jgi:hypothetical protein
MPRKWLRRTDTMKWAGNIMDTLVETAGGRKMREVSVIWNSCFYPKGQIQIWAVAGTCLINMFLRINHAPQFSITKIGRIYASIMRLNTVYYATEYGI